MRIPRIRQTVARRACTRSAATACAALALLGCAPEAPLREPQEPRALGPSTREARVNWKLTGAVFRVADGDTLTLRMPSGDNITVRLSDIDTPEVHHPTNSRKDDRDKDGKLACPNAPSDEPGQPHGKAAGASLAQLAPIGAAASAECYEVDRDARHVCHVFIGQTNVNLEQLRRGAAMLAANPKYVRDSASATAEPPSGKARLGVWGTSNPMNPDQWRSECWCGGRCDGVEK